MRRRAEKLGIRVTVTDNPRRSFMQGHEKFYVIEGVRTDGD